jgi:hypothetical protein
MGLTVCTLSTGHLPVLAVSNSSSPAHERASTHRSGNTEYSLVHRTVQYHAAIPRSGDCSIAIGCMEWGLGNRVAVLWVVSSTTAMYDVQ